MSPKPAAVGGFVLGGLALGVVAVLVFGGMRLFTTTVRALVVFPGSVSGLGVGSPVTFRGVRVGQVESMKVVIDVLTMRPVVPVYIDFEPGQVTWTNGPAETGAPGLKRAVEAGMRAQLQSDSLITGVLGVEIDFHPGTPAVLSGMGGGIGEIPTLPSEMQQLKGELLDLKLPELAQAARQTLATMQHVLDDLDVRIGPLADGMQQTTGAAVTALEAATTAVRAIQADATHTLGGIDQLAIEARRTVVTDGKKLDTLLTTANRAAGRTEKLAGSIDDMLDPRSPLRGDLDSSLRDLAASASSLRTLTRNLERNPTGTIFGGASK
jgi:paraquat-inducible protein B